MKIKIYIEKKMTLKKEKEKIYRGLSWRRIQDWLTVKHHVSYQA